MWRNNEVYLVTKSTSLFFRSVISYKVTDQDIFSLETLSTAGRWNSPFHKYPLQTLSFLLSLVFDNIEYEES